MRKKWTSATLHFFAASCIACLLVNLIYYSASLSKLTFIFFFLSKHNSHLYYWQPQNSETSFTSNFLYKVVSLEAVGYTVIWTECVVVVYFSFRYGMECYVTGLLTVHSCLFYVTVKSVSLRYYSGTFLLLALRWPWVTDTNVTMTLCDCHVTLLRRRRLAGLCCVSACNSTADLSFYEVVFIIIFTLLYLSSPACLTSSLSVLSLTLWRPVQFVMGFVFGVSLNDFFVLRVNTHTHTPNHSLLWTTVGKYSIEIKSSNPRLTS